MIDKNKFEDMRKELEALDRKRENTIELSREVIKISKLIIYAVLRGKLDEASKNISKIKSKTNKLPDGKDVDTNIACVARQELVEAITLYTYAKEGRLALKDELDVSTYEYLLGLCDLTGEMMRMAVNRVIKGNIEEVENIHDTVKEIYHEFLKFNLRNSELRKKSDQIKWNLEKIDGILYDLKIKSRL